MAGPEQQVVARSVAPPPPKRQHTPSDQKGILSNSNVKLDERLDLLDFLEASESGNISGSGSDESDAPTVVGVSASPITSSTVSWRAPERSASPRRVFASALDVALDAERRGALSTLQDDIPASLPWYLQSMFCLRARPSRASCPFLASARTALATPSRSAQRVNKTPADFRRVFPAHVTRSLWLLWRRADDAPRRRAAAAQAARAARGDAQRARSHGAEQLSQWRPSASPRQSSQVTVLRSPVMSYKKCKRASEESENDD